MPGAASSITSLGLCSMYTADAHLPKWGTTGRRLRRGGGGERQGRDAAVSTATALVSGPAPELIVL